jgi:electron transport complex protein RnfG
MGDILKITINLTLICAAAGIILSAVWARTEPVKVYKENQEREAALKSLIPSAESITPVKKATISGKECEIYEAKAGGQTVGYVAESYGRGYSSFIRLLVAVDPSFTVTGIEVLSHGETPGLGDQIDTPGFKGQFKGKALENLNVVKHETDTEIQAISGATISSKGVTKGVREAVETLEKEIVKPSPPVPLPQAGEGNK